MTIKLIIIIMVIIMVIIIILIITIIIPILIVIHINNAIILVNENMVIKLLFINIIFIK